MISFYLHSPDVISWGWLGSKHQLANYLLVYIWAYFLQQVFCFSRVHFSMSCFVWQIKLLFVTVPEPRSGDLRTQKLKPHPVRTQSWSILPLKPGVGQYIAIHATLTARDFFLAYFYPSGPFTCLSFFLNLSRFFLCWLWLTPDSCVGPQNKIGHPGRCRFPCWVPAEYK